MKEYDLNIWYPEDYDPSTGETTYSMTITVQAYIYNDGEYEGEGPMIELTPEETEILRIQMPEWEYQDDWWYGLEGFLKDIAIPPRLQEFLDGLPNLQGEFQAFV
jgi:hypothetical protein